MLIKRTNGASSGSRMSRMLGGVAAATMDRRTFFRRSGVVAGGLAAASALGNGMVTKAKPAIQPTGHTASVSTSCRQLRMP